MIFYIPLIVVLSLIILFGAFFVVKQQSAAVVERFGKFTSVRQSGLQINFPNRSTTAADCCLTTKKAPKSIIKDKTTISGM